MLKDAQKHDEDLSSLFYYMDLNLPVSGAIAVFSNIRSKKD
ncbi:hypothetical protein CKA32_004144 [Geitlerinema sp. FC II]|nr:hypothetical protein CKA32_004144 [Geitlerinema sp. FC II]